MKSVIFISTLVGIFVWANFALATMSSTNYIINWDSIATGGDDISSSASYILQDTMGNTAPGASSSTSFNLLAGYRGGADGGTISFDVYSQSGSGTDATSSSSTTISVADESSFAVNDFVALVQDVGEYQVSAIGKVTSTAIGTVVVDELKNSGTAPAIDGTNDKLYKLSGASIALGDLANSTVSTAIVGFNITTNTGNGHVVSVIEDGNLREGTNAIQDVTDGSVNAGSEEYGGRASDTSVSASTFDTQDTAFTSGFQTILDESSAVSEQKNFIVLKAAITTNTDPGDYSHILSFVLSGIF